MIKNIIASFAAVAVVLGGGIAAIDATTPSASAAVTYPSAPKPPGNYEVKAVLVGYGLDGNVWYTQYNPNTGKWTGVTRTPIVPPVKAAPGTAPYGHPSAPPGLWKNKAVLTGNGTDGNLWYTAYNPATRTWTGVTRTPMASPVQAIVPRVGLRMAPDVGTAPLAVHVNVTRYTGTYPISWYYDYGDGTGVTTSTVHTYAKAGTYTVKVMARNAAGTGTATDVVTVKAPATSAVNRTVYLTLYGWPDNDPPGNAIAYPKSEGYPTVHNAAGGTGTYADPITLASDKRELPIGTRVYMPHLKKYFVMEDQCVSAEREWSANPGFYHFDIWIGGQGVAAATVLAREDALTLDAVQVIVKPASNLAVDTTPLLH